VSFDKRLMLKDGLLMKDLQMHVLVRRLLMVDCCLLRRISRPRHNFMVGELSGDIYLTFFKHLHEWGSIFTTALVVSWE